MKRQSLYERAVQNAKQDNPDGNVQHIRNSTRHYFVFLRKVQRSIMGYAYQTLIKENGKYKFI